MYISFIITLPCFGQEKLNGYVGLSQQVLSDFTYTETEVELGISLALKKSEILFFGTYLYFGNLSLQDDVGEQIPQYKFNSNLLGGGIKYRVNKLSRFYSPIFGFSVVSEVSSNYSGERLAISNYEEEGEFIFRPSNRIGEIYNFNWNGTTPMYYNTYIYLTTPLIVNLSFENSFKIKNGLSINVGIGLSIAKRSVHYKQWNSNEEEPPTIVGELNTAEHSYGEIKTLKNIYFTCGIQYVFSFKSKKE
jgi:hypothetical protein